VPTDPHAPTSSPVGSPVSSHGFAVLHDHATLHHRRHVLPVVEEELVACIACGLCLPHCPTYRVSGLEVLSPRGRITAMRAVELEGAPIDDAFANCMDTCVQCRGCEAACPSGVPFGRLMEGARVALAKSPTARRARGPLRRFAEWCAYVVVLPRHSLLLAATWVLWGAQRLRLVPRRFGIPRLSRRSLRTSLPNAAAPDVYLFTGCVMDAWQRDVHRDALAVMRATGARPGLPGSGGDCCGALHLHAGRVREARRLARRVMASMPGTAPIVVDSAGCGAAMKDYGRVVGTPESAAFAARVRDFSEWVGEQPALALRPSGRTAVVQDPCHLRHVQHAEVAVRRVLAPAYTLVETDDDGLCCGAGGAYAVVEPGLAGEIRDRKVVAIRAAAVRGAAVRGAAAGAGDGGRAPLVVSANPGCSMHLAAAGLDVRHPAELLASALVDAPVAERSPTTPVEGSESGA
jgi:glycolate oxidase iron-sulfur subunit